MLFSTPTGGSTLVSLADTLRSVEPFLPRTLISQETSAAMGGAAGTIPDMPTTSFGFEIRMGDSNRDADFFASVSSSGSYQTLLRCPLLPGSSPRDRVPAEWERIRTLAATLDDQASEFSRSVHGIWLEFDLIQCRKEIPVPGLFFGLRKPACADTDAESILGALLFGGAVLHGTSLPSDVEQRIARCIAAIPEEAYVTYAGVMPARKERALRINVGGLSAGKAARFLEAIGWTGRIERLETFLAAASSYVDTMIVCIDVWAEVAPPVGIECCFAKNRVRAEDSGWPPFLDFLVNRGLSLPEKRDALLAWQGYLSQQLSHELWASLIVRTINHVKIVCAAPYDLSAKAYFTATKKPWADLGAV
jgi:hypothetical protein